MKRQKVRAEITRLAELVDQYPEILNNSHTKDYYEDLEDKLPIKLIEDIFDFKPVTKEMIKFLNENRNCEEVFENLREIGYPVE